MPTIGGTQYVLNVEEPEQNQGADSGKLAGNAYGSQFAGARCLRLGGGEGLPSPQRGKGEHRLA